MVEQLLWFWKSLWRGWWRVMISIFATIGAYDTVVAQFFPNSGLKPIAFYIPTLEYWHWWIILLVFIIIAIAQGSFVLHKAKLKESIANQKVIHSDSASRLFAIDIGNCHILESPNTSELEMVIHTLTLTAFPSQTIEGIYLYLHGDKYEESTSAFKGMPGKTLFQASPTFGQSACFRLPSKLKKGTYSAQIIVYVDGREEKQDFKFEY